MKVMMMFIKTLQHVHIDAGSVGGACMMVPCAAVLLVS
jgi:hypothetical protein